MDARWGEGTGAIIGEGTIRALAADWQITKVITTPYLQVQVESRRQVVTYQAWSGACCSLRAWSGWTSDGEQVVHYGSKSSPSSVSVQYQGLGLSTRRLETRQGLGLETLCLWARDFWANHILTEIIYEGCHTVLRLSPCLNGYHAVSTLSHSDICTTQPMKNFHKKSRDVSSRAQAYQGCGLTTTAHPHCHSTQTSTSAQSRYGDATALCGNARRRQIPVSQCTECRERKSDMLTKVVTGTRLTALKRVAGMTEGLTRAG